VSADNPSFPAPPEDHPEPIQIGSPRESLWLPAPKFQHRYWRHVLLLVVTLTTTTLAGADSYAGFMQSAGAAAPDSLLNWHVLVRGCWYSLPLLVILGAHEFGHYAYCRRHNVDATLPYFIPAPFLLTGTFGAVIRIREAFPSKRALFDIGVAGPIAGFIALVPLLYLGVGLSQVARLPQDTGALLFFGEPLLFKAMAWLHFGNLPAGYDIVLHPLGFAAWWGMLATALNLMPFGQLDGGHIVYALLGRRAAYVSMATLAAAMLLTLKSMSWISMTIMLLVMSFFLGFRHPHIVDEDSPLDGTRRLVALAAFIIFIICFTPVPIQTFIGQ
jgi:membrane-associated protease RseP (regulator of RpoE activity)